MLFRTQVRFQFVKQVIVTADIGASSIVAWLVFVHGGFIEGCASLLCAVDRPKECFALSCRWACLKRAFSVAIARKALIWGNLNRFSARGSSHECTRTGGLMRCCKRLSFFSNCLHCSFAAETRLQALKSGSGLVLYHRRRAFM